MKSNIRNNFLLYVLFVCVTHVTMKADPNIYLDTRFGAANSTQAYVFDTQQTYTNFARAIGNIEFRGGLIPTTDFSTFFLGVTPPLGGTLQQANGGSFLEYYLTSDLTLGNNITFAGKNTPGDQRVFSFVYTTTSSIFLTEDLTLNNLAVFELDASQNGVNATFDGGFNKLILDPNVTFSFAPNRFEIISGGFPITIKNLTIEGLAQSDLETNFNLASVIPINFYNITLVAYANQTAFVPGSFLFQGQNGSIGYGGVLEVNNDEATLFGIDTQSQLQVTPGTTFRISSSVLSVSAVQFADATSVLFLDNCTLDIYNRGTNTIQFLGGNIMVNGTVNIISSSSTPAQMTLGDGLHSANNCNIQILPGSKLIIGSGMQVNNNNV